VQGTVSYTPIPNAFTNSFTPLLDGESNRGFLRGFLRRSNFLLRAPGGTDLGCDLVQVGLVSAFAARLGAQSLDQLVHNTAMSVRALRLLYGDGARWLGWNGNNGWANNSWYDSLWANSGQDNLWAEDWHCDN